MPTRWGTIRPKKFNEQRMRDQLTHEMRRFGADVKSDFEATTATWRRKPDFGPDTPQVRNSGGRLEVEVSTDNNIYGLVNAGAPPHVIRPVRAKVLVFPGVFRPKTKPKFIGSYPGFSGPPMEYRSSVNHPGFKAREFDKTIAKKREPLFKTHMENALTKAAKASGHLL